MSCGLTFELSRHQRWDARARLAKMYRVPPTGPAWPAVGARLERGVRQHFAHWQAAPCVELTAGVLGAGILSENAPASCCHCPSRSNARQLPWQQANELTDGGVVDARNTDCEALRALLFGRVTTELRAAGLTRELRGDTSGAAGAPRQPAALPRCGCLLAPKALTSAGWSTVFPVLPNVK